MEERFPLKPKADTKTDQIIIIKTTPTAKIMIIEIIIIMAMETDMKIITTMIQVIIRIQDRIFIRPILIPVTVRLRDVGQTHMQTESFAIPEEIDQK